MKEYNFQVQSALDGNYVNIVLPASGRQDRIAVRVIKESCPEFLLPFGMTDINDQVTLKYKVPNAVALKYLNGSFTKQMFLDFYAGLLEPFVRGYDWFLDYHYVCVAPDYIYVDKQTFKSSFLYIPEQSYRNTDEEIVDFLKNVLNKVQVTDDSAFLVRLYQYFNLGNVVLSDLDNMIKAEKNKMAPQPAVQGTAANPVQQLSQPRPLPPQAAGTAAVSSMAQQSAAGTAANTPAGAAANAASGVDTGSQPPSPGASGSDDNDMMNALFGASPKKKEKPSKQKKQHDKPAKAEKPEKAEKGLFGGGLFGKKKAKETGTNPAANPAPLQPVQTAPPVRNTLPQQEVSAMTSVFQGPEEESSVTMIVGTSCQAEKCLELIESERTGAIARISLDFPNDFITIGRASSDAVQPDIRFDKSFMQVSRMHLRIERKGDSYYAIDLGSGNHTLIDGQMMVPNMQYPLNPGSVVSIAANMPVRYRVNI